MDKHFIVVKNNEQRSSNIVRGYPFANRTHIAEISVILEANTIGSQLYHPFRPNRRLESDDIVLQLRTTISSKSELKEIVNRHKDDTDMVYVVIHNNDIAVGRIRDIIYDHSDNTFRLSTLTSEDNVYHTGWKTAIRDISGTMYLARRIGSVGSLRLTPVTSPEGITMPDTIVQSPNKDKKLGGSIVARIPDANLIETLARLLSYKAMIADGHVTQEAVVASGLASKEDLTSGVDLIKSEMEFRSKRVALEKLAQNKARLDSLKTREQLQKDAEEERTKLLQELGISAEEADKLLTTEAQ